MTYEQFVEFFERNQSITGILKFVSANAVAPPHDMTGVKSREFLHKKTGVLHEEIKIYR